MTRRRTCLALFAATTLAASAGLASVAVGSPTVSSLPAGSQSPPAASSPAAHQGLTVKGAVGDRGMVSRGELRRFTQRAVTMTYQTSGGPQSHRYIGPLLLDVLKSARPDFSSDRHDPLRYVVLVSATDGFLAAVAWGEIDPELANKRAILALTEDGKQLKRPRLVLPGDHHGARQVYDVASISLLRLTAAMAGGRAGQIRHGGPGDRHH